MVGGERGEFVEALGGVAVGDEFALDAGGVAEDLAEPAAFGGDEKGVGLFEGEVEFLQDGGEVGFGGHGFQKLFDGGHGGLLLVSSFKFPFRVSRFWWGS